MENTSNPAAVDYNYWSGREEAELYVKYRPEYQEVVIPWLIEFYRQKNPAENETKIPLAIDVQCGSGQLTGVLARYCDRVIGIDISAAQLQMAREYNGHENVEYWQGSHTELKTLCSGLKADIITIGLGVVSSFNK